MFDFDGTLTKPGVLDFFIIRDAIGCPVNMPILEFIEKMQCPVRKEKAFDILNRFETDASVVSEPNSGAEDLILYLRAQGLFIGIISRNSLQSIKISLKNFRNIKYSDFGLIISRDDPVKPKPSGDGILFAAQKFNLPVSKVLVVGDYLFDIQAGNNAGAVTVLLDDEAAPKKFSAKSDYRIAHLKEVRNIILRHPLKQG